MCVQALCAAVVTPDVLRTLALVFSGADVMCATGDPTYSTPYLLAQRAGQKLQMEFLHQNKLAGKKLWVPPFVCVHTTVNLATCLQITLVDFPLKICIIFLMCLISQKRNKANFSLLGNNYGFHWLKCWLLAVNIFR